MKKIITLSLTLIMTNICYPSINTEKNLDNLPWVWSKVYQTKNKAAAKLYFRKEFSFPQNKKIKDAFVIFTSNDKGRFYLNGKLCSSNENKKDVAVYHLVSKLRQGENIAAFEVENAKRDAGLIGKIVIKFENGENRIIPIDTKWKVSKKDTVGWKNIKFNDSSWKNAAIQDTFYNNREIVLGFYLA